MRRLENFVPRQFGDLLIQVALATVVVVRCFARTRGRISRSCSQLGVLYGDLWRVWSTWASAWTPDKLEARGGELMKCVEVDRKVVVEEVMTRRWRRPIEKPY